MSWLRRFDPRLHVTAAIGWAVMLLVTFAALAAAGLAAREAERRASADARGRLAEYATQVRDALSMHIEMRSLALQMAAVQIRAVTEGQPAEQMQALAAVRSRFVEFDALAVVDAAGRLRASAGAWRRDRKRLGPVGSEPPASAAAAEEGATVPDPSAARQPTHSRVTLVDGHELVFVAPLGEAGQDDRLVAVMPYEWVEQLLERMQGILGNQHALQLMLASREGVVLSGPPGWLGRDIETSADLSEGGVYLVGQRTQLRLADSLGLGWTVVVRQPVEVALAPVWSTRRNVFLIVFIAGLVSALLAVAATRALMRRLEQLARQAAEVQNGRQDTLDLPRGTDEVARIGATLAQVVARLQGEKRALQALNAELDRRVAQRTARIERMAEQARLAAVSRERLRIARDLHDTLAHSLMALLTQVRLIRKLRSRLPPAELDDELARAEAVAATGLADARAAIAQMRDNGVREGGLADAVRDLVRRFGQRTGLTVTLDIDEAAQAWADERFEAVFRIVEESLRNVERHAQAANLSVALTALPAAAEAGSEAGAAVRACVLIRDDGRGFDPGQAHPGHYGLRGMREQAALIGAELQVDSRAGAGACVRLTLEV